MQKHPDLTRQRLQRFAERLATQCYTQHAPVSLEVFHAPGRISFAEALQGAYRPAQVGEKFGPLWSTHWFRVRGAIPAAWQGCEVHLRWDSASEACIWQDGVPLQGLTGAFNGWQAEPIRTEFCLASSAYGNEHFEYYIEMACNGLFGLDNATHRPRLGELLLAEIAVFDRLAWDLYWDLKVIADMALYLPGNTPRGGQALATANAMVNAILLDDRSTWQAARQMAARFLAERNGDGQHNLSAIGHAHIDLAWLWPMAETRRKGLRTFSTAVRLMDAYPEYRFAASQAQLFDWVRRASPQLFARLKEKAAVGQFIPVGGSWVEPDCNIPSGESLVRQFLYGQRFFQAEFGARSRVFWNPDVFGYSGALPQIMRQAGIDYFLTQKLSWNQFNKPTSHTFIWEGIDGSRVLTHFPPADTYNSLANVKEVLFNLSNFKDHERARESYLLFGFGDGGGGPTTGMLEQLRRMTDVDGLPRTAQRSPEQFFERCAADLQDPLVQQGELYLELHRGTYTSQARTKQANRQAELLLRETEMLAALALAVHQQPYPSETLQVLWQALLANQFHDVIPGSAIAEVYSDAASDYIHILTQAGELRAAALQAVLPANAPALSSELTPSDQSAPFSAPALRAACFNSLSWERSEVVELPENMIGNQMAANGRQLGLVSVPALGYRVQQPANFVTGAAAREADNGFVLENEALRATLTRQGALTSLILKSTGRECIDPATSGSALMLYEDLPNQWDAWDVDVFHLEKGRPVAPATSAAIIEAGPLRAAVAFDYCISLASSLRQIVSLEASSRRLDFACTINWHEQNTFLKAEFPLNVRASAATYEIQFGHVQRPTHFNTLQDLARFESPAQRWADLSEPDFGVAMLNDGKYGYGVHGNLMRLSLLRSPVYPDPTADQGQHAFRYALFPHAGPPQTSGVVEEAYCFNVPLQVLPTRAPEQFVAFFSLSHPALVIDSIKKAEDSQALIVRLYEARGIRGHVRLSSCLPIQFAAQTNLLEDEIASLPWTHGGVDFEFRPFEIITLKLG